MSAAAWTGRIYLRPPSASTAAGGNLAPYQANGQIRIAEDCLVVRGDVCWFTAAEAAALGAAVTPWAGALTSADMRVSTA